MLNLESKITREVLGYLALHEGVELYLNEMVRRFHLDRGNLVRKLHELEDQGVLKSRWLGNQRYYSLNAAFPLIKEYKKIILKTVGIEHSLKEVLDDLKGVQKAILFGSYAEDKMDAQSDLDLLVVGTHDTIELQRKIARFQKEIDREINVVSMSPEEYKRKQKTPFLRSIHKKKKVSLL